MKFQVEQIAICPKDPAAARAFLAAIGLDLWVEDHVVARGLVYGTGPDVNEADLAFNYQATPEERKPLELEILHYTDGPNWMNAHVPSVSHLGMHCSEEELAEWRRKFAALGVGIAQEVHTLSHTNEQIKDSRRYHYVIFDTRDILGVDLKFIVRKEL